MQKLIFDVMVQPQKCIHTFETLILINILVINESSLTMNDTVP